jgi:hypothetical protein
MVDIGGGDLEPNGSWYCAGPQDPPGNGPNPKIVFAGKPDNAPVTATPTDTAGGTVTDAQKQAMTQLIQQWISEEVQVAKTRQFAPWQDTVEPSELDFLRSIRRYNQYSDVQQPDPAFSDAVVSFDSFARVPFSRALIKALLWRGGGRCGTAEQWADGRCMG